MRPNPETGTVTWLRRVTSMETGPTTSRLPYPSRTRRRRPRSIRTAGRLKWFGVSCGDDEYGASRGGAPEFARCRTRPAPAEGPCYAEEVLLIFLPPVQGLIASPPVRTTARS